MVGRPKGSKAPRHLSMETKAKLQARKELRDKEKELANRWWNTCHFRRSFWNEGRARLFKRNLRIKEKI